MKFTNLIISVGPWRSWAPVPCTGCTNGSYAPVAVHELISVYSFLFDRIFVSSVPRLRVDIKT